MVKEGISSAVQSAGRGAPPRLTLNLEVLFLTLGGGSKGAPGSAVRDNDPFDLLGPTFSTSPCLMSSMISFMSSSLSSGLPRSWSPSSFPNLTTSRISAD